VYSTQILALLKLPKGGKNYEPLGSKITQSILAYFKATEYLPLTT
jgi:hypothetical protein